MIDRELRFLREQGYQFECTHTGYRVMHRRHGFIRAARARRYSGRGHALNLDRAGNLKSAVSVARDHFISQMGDLSPTQYPPPWYVADAMC